MSRRKIKFITRGLIRILNKKGGRLEKKDNYFCYTVQNRFTGELFMGKHKNKSKAVGEALRVLADIETRYIQELEKIKKDKLDKVANGAI